MRRLVLILAIIASVVGSCVYPPPSPWHSSNDPRAMPASFGDPLPGPEPFICSPEIPPEPCP